MRAVIVEDEERAANRLKQLISSVSKDIDIVDVLETVRESVAYDWAQQEIELIFLDIHLADGSSFEIFNQVDLDIPIIFITAYDQYALEAFQVNSIDYLLKPVQEESLTEAIQKFHKRIIKQPKSEEFSMLLEAINRKSSSYIKNLLVHSHQKLVPVPVEDFGYFFIENGLVKGRTLQNKTYILDQNLDELEQSLDPEKFFRANRQIILRDQSVREIESYFNSRLLVQTNPPSPFDILISKAKAREFKQWIRG